MDAEKTLVSRQLSYKFNIMGKYYCKHCGQDFNSVFTLTHSNCQKNPHGKNHELYEGGEKKEYTCKYCGRIFPSIFTMTHCTCNKNPYGKNHSPAL